jgi:hypothetical protein
LDKYEIWRANEYNNSKDAEHEYSPKVQVATTETSCQEKPVATLTVMTSTSALPSLFCTSMPPGRTSHWISPPRTLPASPSLLLLVVLLLEELLLNSFLGYLSLIIFGTDRAHGSTVLLLS